MKNVLLLLSVLGCLSSVYGQKVDTTLIGKQQTAIFNRPTYDYSIKAPKTIDDNQDLQSLDITSKAGNLAGALGDNIYNVDSLVVRGTVDAADIRTLWDASFKGRLSVINLENAEIENGIIPEDAFWHQKEQLDPSWEFINTIHLRRIILPDGVKRIEEMAFSYCINLEEVNIPSSLQYLGTYAFSDCVNLKTDPLVFSEGFERFGNLVFQNCRSLTGEVVLPSTIKEIGDGAFFCSKISSINLPEGLEKIGDAAFYACRLKEVWIPNSCQTIAGTNTFQQNYPLKKIHLPEGLGRIPSCFANDCWDLQEVNIPSTVKSIDRAAFEQCKSLKKINLPDGLETIEREAFYHCDSLEQIIFPATLNFLGQECCSYMPGLKRIYCMSSEPPVCKESTLNPGNSPFGKYNSDFYLRTPNDIPIYVPVGTAEKYRNAWGWDYFTNFIETDDFPTAIHNVTTEHYDSKNCVYDLMGRKVINPQKGQVYIKNGKKTLFAY
uniref:leucine-rich repeat protein n=1 Tax=Prevotella sp. TaxID=59823 RepID=UPI004029A129